MSQNIIITIGHHSYKFDPPEFLEETAPVFSKGKSYIDKDGKMIFEHPFLGKGYYFWDNNLERAKNWGYSKYKDKLKIRAYNLTLKGDTFLDLVGSREDIINFLTIAKSLWNLRGKKSMPINKTIGALIKMEITKPGSFPFKIIRSLNIKRYADTIPCADNKDENGFLMDPEVIICFYDKKDIPLHFEFVNL